MSVMREVSRRHRYLFATVPAAGHVHPAVPIARALVARGHEVRWLTGCAFRELVVATGAVFEPLVDAYDPAQGATFTERFPERAGLSGLAYERFGDVNVRWAMSAERLGRLAVLLDQARMGHRAWLEQTLGSLLPAAPTLRRRTLNALHAATDVYTWKLLRRDLQLSRAETTRTMKVLVSGVLEPHSDERQKADDGD